MNTPAVVDVPPSPLRTVTLRAPTVAPAATVTGTVNVVAFTNVVEPTVRPRPEIDTVALLSNPVPVTVTVVCAAPWPRLDGLAEVAAGAALTVNTPAVVDVPPSPLRTVTLRAPVVAPAPTVTGTVNVVASTNVVEPTVRPVPEIDTVELAVKPVPVTVTVV